MMVSKGRKQPRKTESEGTKDEDGSQDGKDDNCWDMAIDEGVRLTAERCLSSVSRESKRREEEREGRTLSRRDAPPQG